MGDPPVYRILTLNPISSQGLGRLPADRYTVGKSVDEPDAILVRSHDMHAMTIPASVKAIGRAGAGTNNIPVAGLSIIGWFWFSGSTFTSIGSRRTRSASARASSVESFTPFTSTYSSVTSRSVRCR